MTPVVSRTLAGPGPAPCARGIGFRGLIRDDTAYILGVPYVTRLDPCPSGARVAPPPRAGR
jgi:hypothetical protein